MEFSTIVMLILVAIILALVYMLNGMKRDKNKVANDNKKLQDYVRFAHIFDDAVVGNYTLSGIPTKIFANSPSVVNAVELINAVNAMKQHYDQALAGCQYGDVSNSISEIMRYVELAKNLAEHTQPYIGIEASSMLAELSSIEHTGNVSETKRLMANVSEKLERLLEPFAQLSSFMTDRKVDRDEVGIKSGDALDTMLTLSDKLTAAKAKAEDDEQ